MDECCTRYVAHIFIELYFKYEGFVMYDIGTHKFYDRYNVYGRILIRHRLNEASI